MPLQSATTEGAPLADYFWIAGVDGAEVLETFKRLGEDYRMNGAASPAPALADVIQEDAEEEHKPTESSSRPTSTLFVGNERRGPNNRLSTLSRDSEQSNGTSSNRSSATVKGATPSPRGQSMFMEDFDFDQALLKFASERESFLTDLSLSAGAITPNSRPRSRVRTQKIVDEAPSPGSNNLLRSGIGSVRRHMAFRDMNSMKRQPSVARQGELEPQHASNEN
jgi:hypothetical protein